MRYSTFIFDFNTLVKAISDHDKVSCKKNIKNLNELICSGVTIGVISSQSNSLIEEFLKEHSLQGTIKVFIAADDIKEGETLSDLIMRVLNKSEVSKGETIYVGDSPKEREQAQSVGIGSIPFSLLKKVFPIKKSNLKVWQQVLLILCFLFTIYELVKGKWVLLVLFAFIVSAISQRWKIVPDKMGPWVKRLKIRVRALHILQLRGKKIPPIDYESCVCKSCGTTFIGNYCNRCGQSRDTPRYHFRYALRNIFGGLTNIGSGFLRTIIDLFYRPGHMIRDYIGGKRIVYFRPFHMMFVLAAIYIIFVKMIDPSALSSAIAEGQTSEYNKNTTVVLDKGDSRAETIISNINEAKQLLEQKVNNSPFATKVVNLLREWTHGNKALGILLTLPIFAMATLWSFRKKKSTLQFNLTEHLFVQAYIACQLLIVGMIVLIIFGDADKYDNMYNVPSVIMFLLFCWDYKQLYQIGVWKSVASTLLMFGYGFLILLSLAIIVVVSALTIYALL